MSEEKSFLRAICLDPDEDTPRLAFADWLQERGEGDDQDRAEFIRTQIELSHLTPPTKLQAVEVLDEVTGLDGPSEMTLRVSPHFVATHGIESGVQDVEVGMTTGANIPYHDFILKRSCRANGWWEVVVRKAKPWPDRARYNKLLDRQNRLLTGTEKSRVSSTASEERAQSWMKWSFAQSRDAKGFPLHKKGWRFVCSPGRSEQFPIVSVGETRQLFRRGFVEEVEATQKIFFGSAEELFSLCPVREVSFTDLYPRYRTNPDGENGGHEQLTWRRGDNFPEEFEEVGYLDLILREWEGGNELVFGSREEAIKFLSDVAVRYGRKKAGLS